MMALTPIPFEARHTRITVHVVRKTAYKWLEISFKSDKWPSIRKIMIIFDKYLWSACLSDLLVPK